MRDLEFDDRLSIAVQRMFVTVGMLSVGELALDERHLCVDTVRPVDLLRRPVTDPGGASDPDAIGPALLQWRVGEQ